MAENISNDFRFNVADLPPPLGNITRPFPPAEGATIGTGSFVVRGDDLPDLPLSLASLARWAAPLALQAEAATLDFARNYRDMRDAWWKDADKYYHRKANCQATRRGTYGDATAPAISNIREAYDEHIKGRPAGDGLADQAANRFGRASAMKSPAACDMVCNSLRPRGLPLNY
jgi:hypothetical protein